MYTAQIRFDCYRDTTLSAADRAITAFVDALRYNGQILGREFPTTMEEGSFVTRVVCPEEESLSPRHHSAIVKHRIGQLHDAGLLTPKVQLQGVDLHSDHTDPCDKPAWQVLFTSFLSTCSPLRCGEHFAPIPLYRLPEPIGNGDHKLALKWQQDWCAADEIQMSGGLPKLELAALFELGNTGSDLFRRGDDLAKRITVISQIPTYYYLYRVGGESLEQELARKCPGCGGEWKLPETLHGVFDFKCDDCRLVSNLSWDFQ